MLRTWFLTVFSEMNRLVGDLPVAHALGHQLEHLELPAGERGRRVLLALLGLLGERVELGEQLGRHGRRDQALALDHGPDGLGHLLDRDLLQQVAVGARLDGLVEVVLLVADRQHQDLGARADVPDLPGRLDAVDPRHAHVHEDHVGRQFLGLGDGLLAVVRLGDDLDVVLGARARRTGPAGTAPDRRRSAPGSISVSRRAVVLVQPAPDRSRPPATLRGRRERAHWSPAPEPSLPSRASVGENVRLVDLYAFRSGARACPTSTPRPRSAGPVRLTWSLTPHSPAAALAARGGGSFGPAPPVSARFAPSPPRAEGRPAGGQGLLLSRTMLSNHGLPYVGRFACDWHRLATTDPHESHGPV